MRRGLMSWSREELPESVLDARLQSLQSSLRAHGLGAVLAYTSFSQAAPVHWLTNFTPYWSEALLLVLPEGPTRLMVALTPRVHPWIRSVAHVGELVSAPRLGDKAVEVLDQLVQAGAPVGVVALDSLPWSVARPLTESAWGGCLTDASALYSALRQPVDAAQWQLAQKALALAGAALRQVPPQAADTASLTAALESALRLGGAEEVLQRIAPDLAVSAARTRMEGAVPVGARHAVELSVAYKGVWVRLGRSVSRGSAPASWRVADAWYEQALAGLAHPDRNLPDHAPGTVTQWSVESCTGLAPLSVVAAKGMPGGIALPAGSLAVFSVELALPDGPWFRCDTVRVGGAGALPGAPAA